MQIIHLWRLRAWPARSRCVNGGAVFAAMATAMVASLFLVQGLASAAPAAKESKAPSQPTVAVLYFDVQAVDPNLTILRKGLAQMLVTDLVETDRWKVVERSRLEAVLSEQKLQSTAKMDRATVVRVGKLLGARFLVLGSVAVMSGSARLDAHVVDVETGALVTSAKASGKDDDFFGIEGQLAERLRKALEAHLVPVAVPAPPASGSDGAGTSASRVARTRRLRRPAKLSIATAQRYAAAIDRGDRGDTKGARKGLEAVVAEAPEFELAYLDLQAMAR